MKKKLNINRTTRYNIMLLVLLAVLMIFFTTQNDRFFTLLNLMGIVRQTVPQAIIACGLCFVVIAGGIDLSTGSCMGLSAIIRQALSGRCKCLGCCLHLFGIWCCTCLG